MIITKRAITNHPLLLIKNDKPQPSAVYKMEFVSEFDNDRDAKEFAVLKCLEENRIVCPCIVCNNLTRNIEEDDECFIGKIGDVSCKKFKLYLSSG